jgi:tetratricopeptide (TPR) repeat protein
VGAGAGGPDSTQSVLRAHRSCIPLTEALTLIDKLLPSVANPSFDLAILSQVQGQLILAEGRYEPALAPLQLAVELGERHGFFDERTLLDTLYLVGQLHAHLAAGSNTLESRQRSLTAALDCTRRWQSLSPVPSAEVHQFFASLLYQNALLDPAKPDLAQLQLACLAAAECLVLENTPRESSYVMLLAIQQQLGRREAAADTLELLVKLYPDNELYWQQLAGTYRSLAADAPDPLTLSRYQMRVLITLERAEELGKLPDARDQARLLALRSALRTPSAGSSSLQY